MSNEKDNLLFISNCFFKPSDSSQSTLVIPVPAQWTCAVGYWMQTTGTFYGPVDGCLNACSKGYFGNSTHLTAPFGPNGCTPCPQGHFCADEATAQPSPCPVGTHMPVEGAARNGTCLPVRMRGSNSPEL